MMSEIMGFTLLEVDEGSKKCFLAIADNHIMLNKAYGEASSIENCRQMTLSVAN